MATITPITSIPLGKENALDASQLLDVALCTTEAVSALLERGMLDVQDLRCEDRGNQNNIIAGFYGLTILIERVLHDVRLAQDLVYGRN